MLIEEVQHDLVHFIGSYVFVHTTLLDSQILLCVHSFAISNA